MLAIVSQIPVSSFFVPRFLECLIDKKVANIALNILERFVDLILSWIYCPYHFLYANKLERVHHFQDGTPLIDCTEEGIAKIEGIEANGTIHLFNRQVFFSINPPVRHVFSRETRTAFVSVHEENSPGHIQIIEEEIPHPDNPQPHPKAWAVNTQVVHQFAARGQEPVFLAESAKHIQRNISHF